MIGYKYYHRYIRPYAVESKKEVYTLSFLSVVSIIIFGIFVVKPAAITLVELQRKIVQMEDVEEVLDLRYTTFRQLETEYNAMVSPESNVVDLALPNSADIPQFLLNLVQTFDNNSVALRETTIRGTQDVSSQRHPSTDTSKSSLQSFNVILSAQGSYENTFKALKTWENSLRQVQLQKVTIVPTMGDAENVNSSIDLEVFFLQESSVEDFGMIGEGVELL